MRGKLYSWNIPSSPLVINDDQDGSDNDDDDGDNDAGSGVNCFSQKSASLVARNEEAVARQKYVKYVPYDPDKIRAQAIHTMHECRRATEHFA